ncbi:MAG: hypothetical protein IT343_18865 [Candidatus Melainabacteria bacterium]|jgi:hypothetical protein|nr:hypothetical protein [Candidatus Melainabacteria bacterium]
MKTLIESKLFPWIVGLLLGALMGFLVGPAINGWVFHESLPTAFRVALAIIAAGLTGLVIEKALARRPAPVDADRKPGKVDKVFGVGRVIYTVTPNPDSGRIQFNITTHGVSGRRFNDLLLPMLKEIDGVEWSNPVEPTTGMQRQALKRYGQRQDAIAKGIVPPPPIAMERSVSGTITAEASLLRVIEMVEERLGSAQPL